MLKLLKLPTHPIPHPTSSLVTFLLMKNVIPLIDSY